MGWVGNGGLTFEAVGLGSKWWARVQSSGVEAVGLGSKWWARIQSSGVELETADSRLKQWGRAGNGGLAFEAVGVGSKWRARVWAGSKRRAHV